MMLYAEDVPGNVISTTGEPPIDSLQSEGYIDCFINSGNKLRNQRTLKSYYRHELILYKCITCQNEQGADESYVYAVSHATDSIKGLYVVHVYV